MPDRDNKAGETSPERHAGPLYLSIRKKVTGMLQNDIPALTQWMYRLDIDEEVFMQAMQYNDPERRAHEITLAMAARMERIIQTREAHQKQQDNQKDDDPDLAW